MMGDGEMSHTVQCEPAVSVMFGLSNTVLAERCGSFRVVSYPWLSADVPLRQSCHWKLQVPAVVSYVTIVGAELGVFQAVAAHSGVLVVD